MSENTKTAQKRVRALRHRGRLGQVSIYFGKFLRMFVYQSDWKVLPMAVLIAAVVSMVVRKGFFINQEGTLKGAFALTCVSIWNGCFNSIQVICRERAIIKREHRSGMHISSYIFSHMLYQALLCLMQTALTMYVTQFMGVQYPTEGMFTKYMIVDIGITVFLMTYASDMLSLWISALVHSTTTAMTIMPFVLIFQLVFSGGIFKMPEWTDTLSYFTISNCGFKCVAAQSDYNNQPLSTIWTTLQKVDSSDTKINVKLSVGQIVDALTDESTSFAKDLRNRKVPVDLAVGSLIEELGITLSDDDSELSSEDLSALSHEAYEELVAYINESGIFDKTFTGEITLGEIIDYVSGLSMVQNNLDKTISINTTAKDIFDIIGRDRLKYVTTEYTKTLNAKPVYDKTKENIGAYWLNLCAFIGAFALLAVVSLEFIDKDKR